MEERSLAKVTVDEVNETVGRSLGYHIDLIGWEDVNPGYGRPQGLINKDVEQCEYFIGLMWQRWGTPPGQEHGGYTSGFEEEFELALKRRMVGAQPEISLFFKDISPERQADPGDALKEVLAFRKRMETEKRVLYQTFKNEREYLRKLRRCLFAYLENLTSHDAPQPEQQQDRATSPAPDIARERETQPNGLFSEAGMHFARTFLNRAQTEPSSLTSFEVARFRLLADIARRQGNDDNALGVHDANLIYTRSTVDDLGQDEIRGLADCGFRNFIQEAAPLWRWLALLSRHFFMSISTISGSGEERRGALSAMALIQAPLWIEAPHFNRSNYLGLWFAPEAHTSAKVAALSYLALTGVPDDIEWIKREIERNDFQTRSMAEKAIIRIRLRQGVSEAIRAVAELQPADLDEELTNQLFSEETIIDDTSLLESLISQRGKNVRMAVLHIMKRDGVLTTELAHRLLADSEVDIRFQALQSLEHAGQVISDSEARKALVKPGLGILSTDNEGERLFGKYQIEKLKQLSAEQLNERVESSFVFDQTPYWARAQKYFAHYGQQLRADVDDQFTTYFDARTAHMEAALGRSEQIRNLSEFLRKGMTRAGLDILCGKMVKDDLALVRRVLDSEFLEYSSKDVAYLARFGDWSDVERLVAMTNRPAYGGMSLLSFSSATMTVAVAKAILHLGRNRLREVLDLNTSANLKKMMVANSSRADFSKLSTDFLCTLLRSEDQELRKSISLKCLTALSKARLKRILGAYVAGDQFRYYNVVHWLDFGISMPSTVIASAAKLKFDFTLR